MLPMLSRKNRRTRSERLFGGVLHTKVLKTATSETINTMMKKILKGESATVSIDFLDLSQFSVYHLTPTKSGWQAVLSSPHDSARTQSLLLLLRLQMCAALRGSDQCCQSGLDQPAA